MVSDGATVGRRSRFARGGARILVADPDAFGGQLVVAALRADGHRVEWVADGETAAERCSGGQVDLLVLELELPVLHGLRVVRRVSASPGQRCVVLTSRSGQLEQEVLAAGADAYLSKPFDPETLRSEVRSLLEDLAKSASRRSLELDDLRELREQPL